MLKYLKRGLPGLYIAAQLLVLLILQFFGNRINAQVWCVYGLISVFGVFLIFHDRWELFKKYYLLFWSAFHSILLLGFLSGGNYYMTLREFDGLHYVNLFLAVMTFWIFYLLTGKIYAAIGFGNLTMFLVGGLNHYLIRFRGIPFMLSDVKAAKTAKNVADSYNYMPDLFFLLIALDFLLWFLLVYREWKQKDRDPFRKNTVLVSCAMVLGCVVMCYTGFDAYAEQKQTLSYEKYLASALAQVFEKKHSLKQDYSLEEANRIIEEFMEEEATEEPGNGEKKPHLVVIMNESFADLRVFGDLPVSEEIMPFWDTLQAESVHGFTNASILAGNTANSEYEFLTSDAVGVYDNLIPYDSYFNKQEEYPGMVSVLEAQGYETNAFHPFLGNGYNRNKVYPMMGFDRVLFDEALPENVERIRQYASDRADYQVIMEHFANKDFEKPQFFFNVTMQNHGGYTYSGDNFTPVVSVKGAEGKFPQAEQYLSLVRESDRALEELFAFFKAYDEPVVVVVFGDHQPKLEDDFYRYITGKRPGEWDLSECMKIYETPFVIWKNYEQTEEDLGDVSINYLGALLLQKVGLSMSPYQRYTLKCYEEIPVVTKRAMIDKDGSVYSKGTKEYEERIREYRTLICNHTVDKEGRAEAFFTLSPQE